MNSNFDVLFDSLLEASIRIFPLNFISDGYLQGTVLIRITAQL